MPLTSRQVADAAALAERLLICLRHAHGVPGIAYGMAHDGNVVLLGANGLADVASETPVDAVTTRFRCASITKTFTATLVMRQVERGRLRLDDPVTEWLPWTRRTLDARLTLRHLLQHTGSVIRDGTNAWDDRTMPDKAQLHAELSARATFGEPAERFRYSNMAYALLGEVLETVSRTSFTALLRREISRPLGLDATDGDLTPAAKRALATGYYAAWPAETRRAAPHVAARAIAPAGGLVSTVGDLLVYQQAHLPGDERLLSELSKREMQRALWQRDGEPHYGLGWMRWHASGIGLVGHSGGYPGFVTKIAFAPEERLTAAVLSNAVSPMAPVGLQLVYDAVSSVASRWEGASAPSRWHSRASLARFGGIYRDHSGTVVVGRVANSLLVVPPQDAGAFLDASLLAPRGAERFEITSGNDFGFLGEEVRFRSDRRGKVTTLVWGAHQLERADL